MIIIPLLVGAIGCLPPSDTSVAGFWESRKRSKGGIGNTLELRRDGVSVASTTVIVNLFYRTSKDRLFVGEDAKLTKQSPDSRFEVQGDALVLTGPDGSTVKKERLGVRESGGDSIVGAWRYRHYTEATAYERYTEDGRLLFRLPMNAYVGCYSVSRGQLSTTEPKFARRFALAAPRLCNPLSIRPNPQLRRCSRP